MAENTVKNTPENISETPNTAPRVLSGQQLQRAAGVVAAAFVLSAIVGVVRQAIVAAQFGAGFELDAFNAAYRIPDTLFALVAGGALGSTFIPIFGRFISQDDTQGAWRLASSVMTIVTIVGTLLAVLAGILAPFIVSAILLPAASPEQQALTVSLMRIMLVSVVIFAISGLVMGILNTMQHFLTPALAPSMNNIGLIIGALLLSPRFGIHGMAIGAVIGSLLHLGIQLPRLYGLRPALRPLLDVSVPGTREVFWLMGPRILGQGVVQINFIVNTTLTSGMPEGSYTALVTAFALMFTVLGVLGQSIGTAVFPSLAVLGADGNMAGFRQTLSNAIRNVLFMSIPATVGILILANPFVATIAQRGNWTPEDTVATTWALRWFVLGLVGFALQEILARAFFALRDTATPVKVAVGGVILNIVLSLILIQVVHGRNPSEGAFGGLALANALATIIESAALWILLRRRIAGLNERIIADSALRTSVAAVVMGLVVYVLAHALTQLPHSIILVFSGIVGLVVFEIAALLLGISEARSVPNIVLRRFKR